MAYQLGDNGRGAACAIRDFGVFVVAYEMGDEMRAQKRPRRTRCRSCRGQIRVKAKGRIPTFCSHSCKQKAYLTRRYQGPMELLAKDIATWQVRVAIRQEVMSLLAQLGFVTSESPPLLPSKPRAKPKLRLISKET
jgi:hypothetical protein